MGSLCARSIRGALKETHSEISFIKSCYQFLLDVPGAVALHKTEPRLMPNVDADQNSASGSKSHTTLIGN